ncbi:GIY-YIG nuclease family protein [Candidatus Gracilibacteria bacterium]|nr:GIY-YIG nuclease family protein [Candidatus Gracilibacteria bacterium]
MKEYFVYIMASDSKTIYIGVTNNLVKRVFEHKNKVLKGFTEKYGCNKLVYFEKFYDVKEAIGAEKTIKNYKREWKVNLIEKENPDWLDLSLD